MTPEQLEFAKWALGSVAVFLGTAIGFLFRIAFKLGSDAQAIKEALKDLVEVKETVKKVPILETRMGTLEQFVNHIAKTTRSDIKELRNSNGDWSGHESEE